MLGLIYVLLLLASANFFGDLSEKIGQPRVVGEIIGGIIVGPLSLFLLNPILELELTEFLSRGRAKEEVRILVDLAKILLMLGAGFETDLSRLYESGRNAFLTAIGGMTLPMTLGYLIGRILGLNLLGTLFLAASMSITAVALSVSVLVEMGKLNTRPGMTIVGAAVIDDVMGIFILSVLLSMLNLGHVPALTTLVKEISISLSFIVGSLVLGPRILSRVGNKIRRLGDSAALGLILSLMIFLSILAEVTGLHAMIGSYVAGLIAGPIVGEKVEEEISAWVWGFFAPLFFAWVGFSITFNKAAFGLPLLMIVAGAFVGKIVGSGVGAFVSGLGLKNSILVGVGMNARAAVELIVAEIAMEAGIINDQIFSAIVVMAIITSILTPITLKKLATA